MKYSVLMSVYKNDDPAFLKTALESIYEKQTRKPDEIVVVFDGELTQELYETLDNFRKNKEDIVCYYPQETNRGLGQALRIGSEKCSGDYILRMDSDDISHPDRFQKQIDYIEAHPDIDVLGGNISEFNTSPENEKMRRRICPQKYEDIIKMSKMRNPMNHVSVCIKRKSLLNCGGYEPVLLMEDYYLWLKMIAGGCKLENLDESLVYVRIGNGFEKRRSSKVIIKSRRTIQKFMLKHNMIKKSDAFMNMAYIIGFVYCPNRLKKLVYNKFLRG